MDLLTKFLGGLVLALLVLMICLVLLVFRFLWKMVKDLRTENQKLRNLLMARDLQTLHGLNHATGISQSSPEGSDTVELTEESLLESINVEELLAQKGYEMGDLNGLEGYGWASPITKRNGDGEPIAYE